ncbi:OLC1v1023918C1 [Oldenlandia corymbosa var. corymbosa]|uniref:OLC1v1023918C1 n=1 Tax=Oldenlandia corymbosa var. corymbosa TaxID=529605 RepID=A0AAV1C3H2_OLDCO|nr:OLC1v1023918C1 [Oldenlandia corymbosa var. corymbosa]
MWRWRDYTPTEGDGDGDGQTPIYGEGSNLITVKLCHGGGFVLQNKYSYMAGEVEYFDKVDSKMLTKEGLETLVDRTKYCRPHKLYFKDPNMERHGGYRVIGGGKDVYDLIALKNESGIVEVFRQQADTKHVEDVKGSNGSEANDSDEDYGSCDDLLSENEPEDEDRIKLSTIPPKGNPPKLKKMGRPPKPKKNPTSEGTSNLPKRRGRKPTAKSVCKNCNQTGHFRSICPLLERRREMVKEIEERQALNEASLNLSRTNGIEQPQPVVSECAACDSTTHTVETCPILKETTQMEEEYLRSCQNVDNGQMEEEISTPNASPESQAGDDVDYDNTPYLIKCDYCPQFGHTKEDCPKYELDVKRGKKKTEESAEVITAALDEIINTPNAPQQSKKRPASSEPDVVILSDQSGHQVKTLRGRTVFVPAHDQATKKRKKGKQSVNSGSKAEARKIQKLFCHVVPKPVNDESDMAKQLEKLKEPDGRIHWG